MQEVNALRHFCSREHGDVLLRAVSRYRELLRQLIAEGLSQQEVAERIGYGTQGSISRIVGGTREISVDQLELAVRRLGLNPQFFFGPGEGLRYRDFSGVRKVPDMGYPAFFRFLKMADESGMELSLTERNALQRQDFDGDPTPETYFLLLQALRTLRMPEETQVRQRPEPPPARRRKRS